jgi:hypothetical protein
MKSNEAPFRLYAGVVSERKFFFLNRNLMMLMIKMVIVTINTKAKELSPSSEATNRSITKEFPKIM